jgi:hypothetical protein
MVAPNYSKPIPGIHLFQEAATRRQFRSKRLRLCVPMPSVRIACHGNQSESDGGKVPPKTDVPG